MTIRKIHSWLKIKIHREFCKFFSTKFLKYYPRILPAANLCLVTWKIKSSWQLCQYCYIKFSKKYSKIFPVSNPCLLLLLLFSDCYFIRIFFIGISIGLFLLKKNDPQENSQLAKNKNSSRILLIFFHKMFEVLSENSSCGKFLLSSKFKKKVLENYVNIVT